jgi:hypothetical protein
LLNTTQEWEKASCCTFDHMTNKWGHRKWQLSYSSRVLLDQIYSPPLISVSPEVWSCPEVSHWENQSRRREDKVDEDEGELESPRKKRK